MLARSPNLVLVAVLLLIGCGSPAPVATPSPTSVAAATPTAVAPATATPIATVAPEPTPAPTQSPATATAAPTPFAGPVVNPDGSVWITQGPGWGFVMAGDDAIWAIYQEGVASRSIVRIDPATNETQAVMTDLPVLPNPIAAVGVNGSIWVASWDRSSVTRYDAGTGDLIEETEVGLHPVDSIYAYGDFWTTEIHGNSVTRFDTETGDARTIEMDPPGSPIGFGAIRDDLAVVGNPAGLPYLIDPKRMTIVGQFDPGTGAGCVPRTAAIEGNLWIHPCVTDTTLWIMDPERGEKLGEVNAPVSADPPFVVDDVMWLPRAIGNTFGHGDGRSWVGIDAETHEVVAEYEAPSRFTDGYYAIGFDSIWMFGHEGILRIPASTLEEISG